MSSSNKEKGDSKHIREEANLSKLIQLTKTDEVLNATISPTEETNEILIAGDLELEKQLLEWFASHYYSERKFAQHHHRALFSQFFSNIIKSRITHTDWPVGNTFDCISRCFICLRILMRDSNYQRKFVEIGGIKALAQQYRIAAENYLFHSDSYLVDVLSNISLMVRKLANIESNNAVLFENEIHRYSIVLLDANDTFILQCALLTLIDMSSNPKILDFVVSLSYVVDKLVQIIGEYDSHSRAHAANLLRIFCSNRKICEMLIIFDCLPTLLSVLHHGNQCLLLFHIVWILVQLCRDPQHVRDIRALGGIPLLLNLLQDDRALTVERHEITSANMRNGRSAPVLTARTNSNDTPQDSEVLEHTLKLKSVCCTALSELGLENSQTIVEGNGVYIIAKLIIFEDIPANCQTASLKLKLNAFRALRFLFSMERNRRLFKRLFPPEMFQAFIDIGHYVRTQESYQPLVDMLDALTENALDQVRENIEELNQNRTPRRFIRGIYAVIDLLGSGAFGSVYKVKKENDEKPLALKEVSIFVGGKETKSGRSRQKKRELDEIVRELTIIKEQLRHPNVVRYYKTFQENDKLYIEMDLIEGASLQEHFNSLIEKKQSGMEEDRVWRVLIQLCLALRYLHKEKHIVHRDLTPGNIMLGENDHVTITDFGLAKQKQDESKLYSVVGTLLYSCPEIIKSEPYGEKADIWALGCILYQMTTLRPPFPSDNMLSLAKKIAEARFEPIPGQDEFITQVNETVTKCLSVEPDERPDIVEVVSLIAAPMLRYTDNVTKLYHKSERKLEKERRRTQKNYHEAKRNMENYRSLFKASQESNNRIYRNFSMSNAHTFTQQEKFQSFNPNVSSPAIVVPTTPPNGHKHQSSSETTSPGSDVFSEASSSGYTSLLDALPPDSRHPHPPRSRPNSGRNKNSKKQEFPCRALSFDMSEQGTARDAMLSRVGTAPRGRPGSASNAGTLTISPRKVRQITDPVQTMLHQLHKIIFIDQLPPTTEVNFCRRIISRYKRALFQPQSTSINLKTELKKLLSGSQDSIDAIPIADASSLARQATAEVAAKELSANGTNAVMLSPSSAEEGVTYSQMYTMIENVLCDCGYYDVDVDKK